MSPKRTAQYLIVGLIAIITLACLTAVVLLLFNPLWLADPGRLATPMPVLASWTTPLPASTSTPTAWPSTSTPIPSPSPTPTIAPPTPTPSPTNTSIATPSPTATPSPLPPAPAEPPVPTPPSVDFVVVQQRMRTNEENSWEGKVANNCGGDHTIYVQVVDAAGQPLTGVLVGDTYRNVRASSGMAGPGRLEIELWSNTMSLEVQGNIDGTPYTSQQTLPLSTRDEDIPAEWLFAGGYCASIADCQLRQQTNGLCRGHYSYDVVFQRTW